MNRTARSISNRRSRSSRNAHSAANVARIEHIESEIALKPEPYRRPCGDRLGAYRIGDRAQAGTNVSVCLRIDSSISNRRSRSSRNLVGQLDDRHMEHIESEIALKPEHQTKMTEFARGAYRIGDRAQAGTRKPVEPAHR